MVVMSQERSLYQLAEARRIANETEEIAQSTLSELSRQKEILNKTKSRVDQVDSNLNDSNRRINSMNSQQCTII